MPRPAPADLTEQVYAVLPELYRTADETDGNWPLLRYLAGIGDALDPVGQLVDQVRTALVDPELAPTGWLPWLAQLLGVPLDLSTPDLWRPALEGRELHYLHGTLAAMEALVRPLLTGTQTIVWDFEGISEDAYGDAGDTYGGAGGTYGFLGAPSGTAGALSPWAIGMGTHAAETPSSGALIAAAKPEKPAGFVLTHYWLEAVDIDGGDVDGPWEEAPTDGGDSGGGHFEVADGGNAAGV